jgi:photosystem II stability/assembly factor-like uncharacterized protein
MRTAGHSLLISILLAIGVTAMPAASAAAADTVDKLAEPYSGMKWREIGPYRGGRSAAITGVASDPMLYYFGATGGGVWKTNDAGGSWSNISDGFFGGSIGAVAVAPSDLNVIYVGTGESTIRGNMSQGEGVWKSTDAGRSWSFAGLAESRTIPRIVVDQNDPDTAYAAVLGDVFAPSDMRGIYKTTDGAKTWRRVLFVNNQTGADDLSMDPTNPRILYASTWRVQRGPNFLSSGGVGSGLWKSIDRGETWVELSGNPGLPKTSAEQPMGICSIVVSPSAPDNLYAMVEHAEGGLFRSKDAGKTWARVSEDRAIRQRAWYFSRVVADPKDAESVWVLNVRLHRSSDGGKNFTQVATPHGDHHDHWVDPNNPKRMANANDGGATITIDGGVTWSSQANQPTSQLYRVSVDSAFPYRLLAGQQDNSALRIRSRSLSSGSIGPRDWEPTAGGESGWISAKPGQPDLVFGGSYMGFLMRLNHANDAQQLINVWPEETMGHAALDTRIRFQWNFPLLHSRHDSKRLFAAGNRLYQSTNDGQSWQAISPDLTRNDPKTLGASGGPITKDNTSVEYYATIFALAESVQDPKQIWAASDDGLVHITLDGGANWRNITPRGAPADMQWNSLEASPFSTDSAYLVGTRYKLGDRAPYLYRTNDRGSSWQRITVGIAATHFTRALRADPARKGLLYAGTERGLYLSEDDGANWRSFQLNLPIVPITDLAVHQGDVIAATQGRGFWLLDDTTPLAAPHSAPNTDKQQAHLYPPRLSYRLDTSADENPKNAGRNPLPGSALYFRLPRAATASDQLSLEIRDSAGKTIMRYTRKPSADELKAEAQADALVGKRKSPGPDVRLLPGAQGLNYFAWNARHAAPAQFDGLVLWNGDLGGPKAVPGNYQAVLSFAGVSYKQSFELKPDPRSNVSMEDLIAQRDLALQVSEKLTSLHTGIDQLTRLGPTLSTLSPRVAGSASLKIRLETLDKRRAAVLESVYQTQLKSEQDPLNFPVRLNDKLAGLLGHISFGDNPPTAGQRELQAELFVLADKALAEIKSVLGADVDAFNEALRAEKIGLIDLR